MHTMVHSPANTRRSLPIALTTLMTLASSQVFIDVRSMSSWPGKASVISWNIGPEKLFSATVVRMVGTLKPAAACEISAALLRNTTASIDFVANDICDWKSIMINAWSCGVRSLEPGVGLAVGMVRLLSKGGRQGTGRKVSRHRESAGCIAIAMR